MHGNPRLWGLHNYVDANRAPTVNRTRSFMRRVPGEVWVTETGGLVRHLGTDSRVLWPFDERRAAAAVARSFALAKSDPRITRLYLYQWGVEAHEHWDSAFIAPGGRARPALDVLRRELAVLARSERPAPARRRSCARLLERVTKLKRLRGRAAGRAAKRLRRARAALRRGRCRRARRAGCPGRAFARHAERASGRVARPCREARARTKKHRRDASLGSST